MSDFLRMVDLTGNELVSAGIGLETIANLLGADGIERHLSDDDVNGLQHVLLALGSCLRSTGYDLCEAVKAEVEDARKGREVDHV
jgi:fructose-specific phosphotransferase system component IIB